jgi:ornithine carbamoyltransferase
MTFQHFLDLDQFSAGDIHAILRKAHALKENRAMRTDLQGKTLALIFEKPSTRTRVSFEVAMRELGGQVISLTGAEMQLGHGESLADTARVLSGFVHGLMVRTFAHDNVLQLAKHARIPVINGLTNFSHPCQVMADLMAVEERLGKLEGLSIAWLGDGDNNVLYSWIHAMRLFGMKLSVACPAELQPDPKLISLDGVTITQDVSAALKNADVVITDTWVSMHQKDADRRRALLQPYQVNAARMREAGTSSIFLHCLPAHRGEEVTDEVIDGPQSAVWQEAENRLHAQKAILLWCFGKL